MQLQDARSINFRYQPDPDFLGTVEADYGRSVTDVLVVEQVVNFTLTEDDPNRNADPGLIRGDSDQAVLGYMSIGQMDQRRTQFDALSDSDVFASTLPNVSSLVIWDENNPSGVNQSVSAALVDWAQSLQQAGFDGVFLDVVDIYNDPAFLAQFADSRAANLVLTQAIMQIVINIREAVGVESEFQIMLGHTPFIINNYRAPEAGFDNPNVDETLIDTFQNALDGALIEGQDFGGGSQALDDILTNLTGARQDAVGFGRAQLFSVSYENTPTGTDFSVAELRAAQEAQILAMQNGIVAYNTPASGANVETFNKFHLNAYLYEDGDTGDNAILNDRLGNTRDDIVTGDAGRDLIVGQGVTDFIDGGDDDDIIMGMGGGDFLRGGMGNDTLDGGTSDAFVGEYIDVGIAIDDFTGGAGGWTSVRTLPRINEDLDDDGDQDFIGFGSAGVLVAMGNENGDFNEPFLALSDFGVRQGWVDDQQTPRMLSQMNDDDAEDIVGFGTAGVIIAYGDGEGDFDDPLFVLNNFGVNQGWTDNTIFTRELQDMNNDGNTDIVGFGIAGVLASFGDGEGNFSEPTLLIENFGTRQGWTDQDTFPRGITDIDGDGDLDLIGAANAGVLVALNDGDGSFADPLLGLANFGARQGWVSDNRTPLFLEDMNNDGTVDIAGFGNAGMLVALGNGDGTFQDASLALADFGVRQGWTDLGVQIREIEDVDGDGDQDVVGFGTSGVSVALNNGDGTFADPYLAIRDFGTRQGYTNFDAFPRLVTDLNDDGRYEVLAAANAGIVLAALNIADGDQFIYESLGWGADTIVNWSEGDLLDFRGSGLNAGDITITPSGGSTLIGQGLDGSTILLEGINAGTITTADDMLFGALG